MEAVKDMNGTIWVFAIMLVGLVVIQSLLFLRLAMNFNKKNKLLTNSEISQAVKTGAVSAIGPALSSVTVAISLIAIIGSGTAFMRCGVIGAPGWELLMANICTQTVGVEFNTPEFTKSVFTLCIFGMTLASAPYFLTSFFALKPLDKAVNKAQNSSKKKKRSFIPYVSNAAMMGLLGYMVVGYMTSVASVAAVITAAVVCFVVSQVSKKINNKTLASFNMAIAMICAMIVGQAITVLVG